MSVRLILGLFTVVTWPHWREHVRRTLLTVIGVSLGVTTVVAIADVSKSVLVSFGDMVETVAGDAELEVSADVGTLAERALDIVRGVDGVEQAEGVIERFLTLGAVRAEPLFLLGADFLSASLWRRQLPRASVDIEDELSFLSNLDSVAAPVALADRMGLELDDEIEVVTPAGVTSLTVRGLIGEAPIARLFDGSMVVMDLPAAQRLLRMEGRLDRIAVRLDPQARLDDVARRIAVAVGPGAQVGTPDARSERIARLMFSLRTTLAIMSLGAVIVGAFIVYHTVAISILQRRREFALLNACGVGRRALVGLCSVETLLLALPGVLLGLVMGKVAARLAAGLVGATVSEIWVHVDVTTFAWSKWGTVIGAAVGLGTAVVSAIVAIRQTFQAPTVEALRPVGLASGEPGSMRRPLVAGAILVGCVWLIVLAPRQLGFAGTVTAIIGTQVLGYVGLALIAAPSVWLLGMLARAVFGGAAALPTRLVADNLPRSPGRSGGIVATMGATMAIAVTVATLIASHDLMSLGWIQQHFGGDLFVGGGDHPRLMPSMAMEGDVAGRVAALPEVESVERFRMIPIDVEAHGGGNPGAGRSRPAGGAGCPAEREPGLSTRSGRRRLRVGSHADR
jgi:putative ABC transport system permease protein